MHLQVGLLGIGDVPCSDDRVPARRVQAFQSVVILQRVHACAVTILLLLPGQNSKYKVLVQLDDGLREATIFISEWVSVKLILKATTKSGHFSKIINEISYSFLI